VNFVAVQRIGAGQAVAAASADGQRIVIVTTTGAVVVQPDNQVVSVPTALSSPDHVEISTDGRFAVLAGTDRSAELWQIGDTPNLAASYTDVVDARFSRDSATLVVTSSQSVIAVPTSSPGDELAVLSVQPSDSIGLSTMSDDAQTRVGVLANRPVALTSAGPNGQTEIEIRGDPSARIPAAVASADGARLIVEIAPPDFSAGSLASWNLTTGSLEWEMPFDEAAGARPWAIGRDGRVLIGTESGVRLVDIDGSVISDTAVESMDTAVSIVPLEAGFVLASADGRMRFLDSTGQVIADVPSEGFSRRQVAALTGQPGLITVDSGGTVATWDAAGAAQRVVSEFSSGRVNEVAVSPDAARVALARSDGQVSVTMVGDSTSTTTLVHPQGNVEAVQFLGTSELLTGVGERLSETAYDDTVSSWDLGNGALRYQINGEREDVVGCGGFRTVVRALPGGELYATSSHDFTVSLHRADDGSLIHQFPPHVSTILDIAVSPAGDRIVTTSDDGAVRVWRLDDYSLQAEYLGPPGGFFNVTFLPGGDVIAAGDVTGQVTLVDPNDGTPISTFEGTKARYSNIAVSPDGSLVAAGTDRGTVTVWSASTGRVVADLAGHSSDVTSTAFSSDGTTLVSGSTDTTAIVWSRSA
jgi:WD40 repeat protein